MLQKSEIILLNEMIEKIYTTRDYRQMRVDFLDMIRSLIPYQQSSYYLASTEGEHVLDAPVGVGISPSELQRYIDDYEEHDYTRWIFMSGKSMVYRETDLFPDKVRLENPYYTDIYMATGIYYSAQMSIAYGGIFLSVISLYRDKSKGDFSDDEMFILELLKGHLEHRSHEEWERKTEGSLQRKNKIHFDAYRFVDEYALTTREVEILGLLMGGFTNETICESLVISLNTLKKHTLSIYKKLGINNRWELIQFI